MISKNRIKNNWTLCGDIVYVNYVWYYVWSKDARNFLGNLRKSSENFRKCSESFVCPSDNTLKNFFRRSEFIGKSGSCFLLKPTADQVTFYHCIAGSIFFMFRVQLESNLHLWVFFRSGSCNFQFFEKLTRANNSIPYDLWRVYTVKIQHVKSRINTPKRAP